MEECTDPAYGDGTCDADLPCAQSDIDCFHLFDDDAAAMAWYAEVEELVAEFQGTPPRAILPATDPDVVRMREYLDEGWSAFKSARPVGDLELHRPGLVVIEDEAPNAFVRGDGEAGMAYFAVVVHTGALTSPDPDESIPGLIMHELAHAVDLHVVASVKEATIAHYTVNGTDEPFGFEQRDDPVVRQSVQDWIAMASDVGSYPTAELGGLPFGGKGTIWRVFMNRILPARSVLGGEFCADAFENFAQLHDEVLVPRLALDDALDLTGISADIAELSPYVMTRLRDDCLAGFPYDLIELLAAENGVTEDAIREDLAPEVVAMIEDVHALDGLWNLASWLRGRMRQIASDFTAATDRPWTAARYFTTEEAADDASVPVLQGMGQDGQGMGKFLFGALGADMQPDCDAAVDAGTPPYGANLADDHHGTCWRVAHIRDMAEARPWLERRRPARSSLEPVRASYRPLPAPRTPLDDVMY